jgi:hypothetical protein
MPQSEITWSSCASLTVADLNMTRDCYSTVALWYKATPNGVFDKNWNHHGGIAKEFHSMLPLRYKSLTALEVQFCAGMIDLSGFQEALTLAAHICQPEACRALGFAGNADIAGKGVSSPPKF